MPIVTQHEVGYFRSVVSRYACGTKSAFFEFAEAREGKCHDNAEAFFSQHTNHPPVRGWLVTELGNVPGCFRIVAHSVNRTPQGNLVDVTPLLEADRNAYRFVEHEGADEYFDQMKEKFPEVYFPFVDWSSMSLF